MTLPSSRTLGVWAAAILVALLASSAHAFSPEDFHWWSGFSRAGLDCAVYAIASYHGDLIAAGGFTRANGVEVSGVARWDAAGARWVPLDGGVDGIAYALTVWNDRLIVAGSFAHAGPVAASNIAAWDGTRWSALGAGVSGGAGEVHALATWSATGALVAGGSFSSAGGVGAANIAQWDGAAWSPLGSGTDGVVYALASSPSGASVIAAGQFGAAGGVTAPAIAQWNGAWSGVGGGLAGGSFSPTGYALATHGADVIVTGDFTSAGGTSATRIAAWNGTMWRALGTGLNDLGYSLAVTSSGAIVAGGDFTQAGGGAATRIAQWNGASWSALGAGCDATVRALHASADTVAAGGDFLLVGSTVLVSRIARWTGAAWTSYGASGLGLDGDVYAVTPYAGAVVVAGAFAHAGGVAANNIARWDGVGWSALGSGTNGPVYALALLGSALVVGGDFTLAGGGAAEDVARWTGAAWLPMGSLGANNGAAVFALAPYASTVAAGGYQQPVSGQRTGFVKTWSGSAWTTIGTATSFGSFSSPAVNALTTYGGALHAGGLFATMSGVSANGVARWSGSSWSALDVGVGGGPTPAVSAFALYGTALAVGGQFDTAGGIDAHGVALWDGVSWSALGPGFTDEGTAAQVFALAVHGDSLIAGGRFTASGASPARGIARWTGAAWDGLGDGLVGCAGGGGSITPHARALLPDGASLYVGGEFNAAGATVASGLVRWDDALLTAVREPRAHVLLVRVASGRVVATYARRAPGSARATIVDARGRTRASSARRDPTAGLHSWSWDTTRWNAGAYFLDLETGEDRLAARFVRPR